MPPPKLTYAQPKEPDPSIVREDTIADEANKKITHLDDFAATCLVKCTLGRTIN